MKDVKIPGVLWVVLLVGLAAVVHTEGPQWGLEPLYIDLAIIGVVTILKSLKLGTEDLNQALDVIDRFRSRGKVVEMPPGSQVATRGVRAADGPMVADPIAVDEIPERPNKAVRWLLG